MMLSPERQSVRMSKIANDAAEPGLARDAP